MRITVLGATGMAGTAVVNEALSRGHEVTAVSRRRRHRAGAPASSQESGDETGSGDEGEGPLEVLGVRAREVDRVVHLVVVSASCGDESRLLSTGGGGVHRGHAHGQGESGDDTDACGSAAHSSSTFDCHCQDFDCIHSCTHHPRVCQ